MVSSRFLNLAIRSRLLLLSAICAGAFLLADAHLSVSSDLRHIASDDNASSDCIGEPRTPLCALDTWKACLMWGEPPLCEKVGFRGMVFRKGTGEAIHYLYSYHVDAVLDIEAKNLSQPLPDQEWFREGYLDVRYDDQLCDLPSYDKCTTFGGGNVCRWQTKTGHFWQSKIEYFGRGGVPPSGCWARWSCG